MKVKAIPIFVLFCLLLFSVNAQISSGEYQILRLKNGLLISGRVEKTSNDSIFIQSEYGLMVISVDELMEGSSAEMEDQSEKIHLPDHYVLSTNAYPVPKGQLQYHNFEGVFNSATIGITDRFSLRGGPIFLNPRVSWRLSRYTAARVGNVTAFAGEFFTYLYGSFTKGSRTWNSTLTLGISSKVAGQVRTTGSMAIKGKIGRKWALQMEVPLFAIGNFTYEDEAIEYDLFQVYQMKYSGAAGIAVEYFRSGFYLSGGMMCIVPIGNVLPVLPLITFGKTFDLKK